MNFLTPWFLLGALAIAGPIVFHLIRRAVRERVPFSSIMFLQPTPPRITRRRNLEHLWLLLLRCTCLVLLATAFARPFFSKNDIIPPQPETTRQIVLLLDTSASMRRHGLWDNARSIANRYLNQVGPGDKVAITTFDQQLRTLVSFNDWSSWSIDQRTALAGEKLNAALPGWMGTQLGLALASAAEQFDDRADATPAAHREIVLISDLQEGASLDGLQGHDWPAEVQIVLERVAPQQHGNAGLTFANDNSRKTSNESNVLVRVTNAGDSGTEKFQLNWIAPDNSTASEPLNIYLAAGQTRSYTAPARRGNAAQIRLTGDNEEFDNVAYYSAPEPERVTIACFGLESANDPSTLRYYFQRALSATPRRDVRLIVPTTNSAFSAAALAEAAFALIPTNLTSDEIVAVRDWLKAGKAAVLVLTDASMGGTLAGIADLPDASVTETTGDYALLGEIDFTHPIFAPFVDPRFSDFSHIHFWKHRRWQIPSAATTRVLAKFDDGSPAIAELSVGKGRLLVLSSGWQPRDSQLAVSSKFPPMMQTMLDWSGAAPTARFQFQTGELIPSPPNATDSIDWTKPDGKKVRLAVGTPFNETDQPGIYTATYAGKQQTFAANLPANESRTAPLLPDELARLGVPLKTELTATTSPLANQERAIRLHQAELERRQKLWRWLIVGVLAVTFGEILLGGWMGRRVKTIAATA